MSPSIHISSIRYPETIPISNPAADSLTASTSCPVFNEALKIRTKVFSEEQEISASVEIEEYESTSWHWVAFITDPSADSGQTGLPKATRSESLPVQGVSPAKAAGTIRLIRPHQYKPESTAMLPPAVMADYGLAGTTAEFADIRKQLPMFAKVTRLAVVKDCRTFGIGRILVAELEQAVADSIGQWVGEVESNGAAEVILVVHGQIAAQPFWEKIGYRVDPGLGEWLEDSIPHVGLWKRISAP